MQKARWLIDDISEWLESHKMLFCTLIGIFVFGLIAYSVWGPGSDANFIRKELSDAGHDVTGIEFEEVEKSGFPSRDFALKESLYSSSSAIEYEPGVFVDEWKLTHLGTGHFTSRYVTPYPALPKPVDLRLNITVSPEEYEYLTAQANGLSVEEYLEQKVKGIVVEGGLL